MAKRPFSKYEAEEFHRDEMEFASRLEASFAEDDLERGDTVAGTVLSVDHQGLIIGVGSQRDGFVSRQDIERLGLRPEHYNIGDEVDVTIVRMEDEENNLVLSISQARQNEDWKLAEKLLETEDIYEGDVMDANRGGLIVVFGNLRGFVPASHVADLPRGMAEDDRKDYLSRLIGQQITFKVIEVNRKRRRLVFSQRDAQRGSRDARKEFLLDELKEGEVRRGVVSGLRDFGAFVDLGGADGLIHISELAWHRVKHPKELLNVGDKVEVYILRLDSEGKRIGLSLKRLQPDPWSLVEEMYHVGQLVEGYVSRTAQFGAFVSLKPGIEALLHVSQIADPPPIDVSELITEGQKLLMRVISVDAGKQRLGLSLKEVHQDEQARWKEKSQELDTNFERLLDRGELNINQYNIENLGYFAYFILRLDQFYVCLYCLTQVISKSKEYIGVRNEQLLHLQIDNLILTFPEKLRYILNNEKSSFLDRLKKQDFVTATMDLANKQQKLGNYISNLDIRPTKIPTGASESSTTLVDLDSVEFSNDEISLR